MSQEQTFGADDLIPCFVYEGIRTRFREFRVHEELLGTVEGRRRGQTRVFLARVGI